MKNDIPLSAGINVIIGDNSVGKSLLLHALTGYYKIEDKGLRDGYKSYCEKESLEVVSQINKPSICEFDDQQSVRKQLEELHSGDSSSTYIGKHFKGHVAVASVVGDVQRLMKMRIDALGSKIAFNDSLAGLDVDFELREVANFSILSVGTKVSNFSYDPVDRLRGDTEVRISDLEKMVVDHAASLTEIGQTWSYHLDNAIRELRLLSFGCELHRNTLKVNNAVVDALNTAARHEKEVLRKKKTDEENDADEFHAELELAASQIANSVLLAAKRFSAPLDLGVGKKEPTVTPMGEFRFVSELTISEFGCVFAKTALASVFNKGCMGQIEQAITGATELTTADVCAAVSNVKPSVRDCIAVITERINAYVGDSIQEHLKVTNTSLGIDEEPSPGLFSRLYFDLVAEEDKPGVYIIDQPEDQISQMSIKDHVIGAFKRMSERRQVILITHNPQFVVNLDVDNVIAIKKDEGQPLKFYSGALEYECDEYGILDIVANTVEGGADVVRKRLKRYGSKTS